MSVILGAKDQSQAKSYINALKRVAYDGGTTGAVIPERRSPIASTPKGGVVADSSVLCKVTGGNSISGYQVQIFGKGRLNPPTDTGVLYATELALTGDLPVNTYILGHTSVLSIVGGND